MLASSGLAVALRPGKKIAEERPPIALDIIVPNAFADWSEEKQSIPQIVDPQQKVKIDKIYSHILNRTYVNGNGYRVMLSIAYGSDQRDSMQVHKPEICYPAQGFVLHSQQVGRIAIANGSIPVTRILTSQGQRIEPVTYWITLGDQVILNSIQKKRAEVRYSFNNQIADGMLVRVSSIDVDANRAYLMQDQFLKKMISAISPASQPRFVGNNDNN